MGHKDTIVLITGGGTGIGRAAALRFATDGAMVVVCGRNLDTLGETCTQALQGGGRVEPYCADVTDSRAVTEMVEQITNRFGMIDILVNNAGQALAKPVLDTTEAEWKSILEVNLLGTVNCCRAVLPSMIAAREGVIINISSVLGKKAIGSMAAYCASKFAVMGFTQSLAEETKDLGIRVHALCPGATDTPLHRGIVGDEVAARAMPPDRVAELILAIAAGSIVVATGDDMVIDDGHVEARPGLVRRLARLFG